LQSYSATILGLYLTVGFVCSTTVLLEPLYAQPSSFVGPDQQPPPDEDAHDEVPPDEVPAEVPGFVPDEVPPDEVPAEVPGFVPDEVPPDEVPPGENPNFGPQVVPEVEEIIEDPVGSVEDTFNTINEKSPVPAPLIAGAVAVVAIGAGIASFSKHHHGRSGSSHSAEDQTQQDDTEEEQIYEDVQVVTQGGIEEV
jgi:hypothetical protein